MLVLAAVATAASVAMLASAGSASATVLCKSTTTPCASLYPTGTELKAQLKGGTKAKFQSMWTTIECNESTLNQTTQNNGSSTTTVETFVEVLSFSECSCPGANAHINVVTKGTVEIHHISGTDNGTLTGRDQYVTLKCTSLGTTCIFKTAETGTDLGTLVGGENPVLAINASIPYKTGDAPQATCGASTTFTAEYSVTSVKGLFVEPS